MILICRNEEEFKELSEKLDLTESEMYDVFKTIGRNEKFHDMVLTMVNCEICDWFEVYVSNDAEWFARDLSQTMLCLKDIVSLFMRGLEDVINAIDKERSRV